MIPPQETIYLAPFQGITDAAYRNAFRLYFGGVNKYFCPYIAGITGKRVSRSKIRDLDPSKNNLADTVPQVLSKDAQEILTLARQMEDWGYTEMNWNLGCPFPRVAKKGRGSGLLQYPDTIREILEQVLPALKISFSIKLRSGYQSHEEIFKILEILKKFPIQELILHPRTGTQIYRGSARPEVFAEVASITHIPLIYNGDLFSGEDYNRITKCCSPTGWMIGRGALRYPFLPSILRGQEWTQDSMRNALKGFHEMILEDALSRLQGRVQVLDRMKPVWAYLCHSFEDPLRVYRKVRKTHSVDEYRQVTLEIMRYYPLKLSPEPFAEKNSVLDGNFQ
ncbi:MAG: tRNA dihydrouridine synthase [Bacteroidales bacterium]